MEIALYSPGMHSVVQQRNVRRWEGWPGIPKTIKLFKQMFLWGAESEKVLIPLLLTSQCCHMRKFEKLLTPSLVCHSETDRCKTPWHWNEQSLSGSAQSNLAEFPHRPQQGSPLEASCKCDWQNNQKWYTAVEAVWLCLESVAVMIFFGDGKVFSWSTGHMNSPHPSVTNKLYACV